MSNKLRTVSTWVKATPTDWGDTKAAQYTYFFKIVHTHKGLVRLKTSERGSGCFQKLRFCPTQCVKLVEEGPAEEEGEKCRPRLQFGEIYGWTEPKECEGVHAQRLWGSRDLRSAAQVIIQSSRSHTSLLESRRLWEWTNLSCAQVACAAGPPKATKQKKNKKKPHSESLAADGFSLRGNRIWADGGTLCSRLRLLTSLECGGDQSNARQPKQVAASISDIINMWASLEALAALPPQLVYGWCAVRGCRSVSIGGRVYSADRETD